MSTQYNVGDRVIWSVPNAGEPFPECMSFSYSPKVINRFGGKELECTVVCVNTNLDFGEYENGKSVHPIGIESVELESSRSGHNLEGRLISESKCYSGQWVLPRHLRPVEESHLDVAFIEEHLSAILCGGAA